VTFFVAGNAADGNGDQTGNDHIYTNQAVSESPTSNVTVALEADPGGLTLQAGSNFMITWTSTGGSNLAGFEARYSTDDGDTFPITNLIFASTEASMTSYNWVVPNTPTTQARIRLQASSQGGSVAEAISARFTIAGGGGPQLPEIHGASVSGKKLFVSGLNFGFGAILRMDGKKVKKTSNDELNPSTMLVSKKGGKQIARGQTVTLVVENPDGSVSQPFSYTRPE
jgi:hypothetical protein